MNGVSAENCLAASSRFSVPTAFTSKSRKGMAAARSCEGCAAVWMISAGPEVSFRSARTPLAIANVESLVPIAGNLATQVV